MAIIVYHLDGRRTPEGDGREALLAVAMMGRRKGGEDQMSNPRTRKSGRKKVERGGAHWFFNYSSLHNMAFLQTKRESVGLWGRGRVLPTYNNIMVTVSRTRYRIIIIGIQDPAFSIRTLPACPAHKIFVLIRF